MIIRYNKIATSGNRSAIYKEEVVKIASFLLNKNIGIMQEFVDNLEVIPNEEFTNILMQEHKIIEKGYIIANNQDYIIFDECKDYKDIILIYIMLFAKNKRTTIDASKDTVFKFQSVQEKFCSLMSELKKVRHTTSNIVVFNNDEMIKACKQARIKATIVDDEVLLTLPNVKIETVKEGTIIYNKILIYLDEYRISRIEYTFNNFTFDTAWGIILDVHPNLGVPYCYNDNIAFAPRSYKEYLSAIIDNATLYNRSDGSVARCINTIMDLRYIYANSYKPLTSEGIARLKKNSQREKNILELQKNELKF